jgi:hypothetical protein
MPAIPLFKCNMGFLLDTRRNVEEFYGDACPLLPQDTFRVQNVSGDVTAGGHDSETKMPSAPLRQLNIPKFRNVESHLETHSPWQNVTLLKKMLVPRSVLIHEHAETISAISGFSHYRTLQIRASSRCPLCRMVMLMHVDRPAHH